jgi:Zn-finger nucleic acid-binding protein
MTCPKCGGEMRRYERNGVDIDQCTECRGIFLDRGELERLTEAETGYYGDERSGSGSSWGGGGTHGSGQHGGGHQGRRKKSFLSELFD